MLSKHIHLITFLFAALVLGMQSARTLDFHSDTILDKCRTLKDKVHAYKGGVSGLRSIQTSFEQSNAAIDAAEEIIRAYGLLSEADCAVVHNSTALIRDVAIDTLNGCRIKLQTMKMPYMKNMFYKVLVERQAKHIEFFSRLQRNVSMRMGLNWASSLSIWMMGMKESLEVLLSLQYSTQLLCKSMQSSR